MNETLTSASIFLLGCVHALEPGHGKTFLLAYTIGQKLNFKKILILSSSLLLSHLLVLSIIAFLINFLLSEIADKFLHGVSHWFAPAIILSFGLYVIVRAFYKKNHKHDDSCGHEHGKFSESKIKNPLTVGFLTGLMPCASSLSIAFMTGEETNLMSIIYFVGLYVLGIALVLFSIVTLFSFAKSFFSEKLESIEKKINLDVISGCLIVLVGLVYLSYNWRAHAH